MNDRPVSGHVFRYEGKRRTSWRAKYRLPDGRQVQKTLGPAWTQRGRLPAGYFTRRAAEAWLTPRLGRRSSRLRLHCRRRDGTPTDTGNRRHGRANDTSPGADDPSEGGQRHPSLELVDVLVRLVPPRRLSLDQALEFVREDEAVEVTPHAVRLREASLDAVTRQKAARARARASLLSDDAVRPRAGRRRA